MDYYNKVSNQTIMIQRQNPIHILIWSYTICIDPCSYLLKYVFYYIHASKMYVLSMYYEQ